MLFCAILLLLVASSSASLYCGDGTGKGYVYYVPQHSCACDAKSVGALRYNHNHIQFCNGKKYVDLVNSDEVNIIGSRYNPAKSCAEILAVDSNAPSGPYYITTGKEVSSVYCYMGEMCGSRGWTMIMKIDGSKTTFQYNSAKWTNKQSYNEGGARGGLDDQETKLHTYHTLPFNKLCLGLKTNGATNWLRLNYKAQSLYSVIYDGKYRAIHLGRDAWKKLVPGSSLQRNCNREGFNAFKLAPGAKARIGIISNQENDCNSPDSRIGFGTGGSYCGQNDKNSAGNEARCAPDNGVKSIKSFGYIFAQGRMDNAPLGSYDNPASSCREIKAARSESRNGAYLLKLGASIVKVYCYMDEICGAKGWAMIMKIDGNKNTFHYNSAYWTNKATYNTAGAFGGLDNQETKLETYAALPFDALCLGMKTTSTRWLKVPQKASSLYSLIADNKYRATRLGRNAWKSLVPGSSLQRNCNREGFNAFQLAPGAKARIGIISNQENDCNSPDSRIGFGTGGSYCGQNDKNSAGNEARCAPDNGNKSIKGLGFIFAQ